MSMATLANSPPVTSGGGPWAVETHGLTKRFGDNVAVDDVELLVPRGVAFGYLGPNGAGKTTLIRVLLGLTHADAGTMSLLGHEVPRHRDLALARVGAIVDEPRFHGHLTGRQNLQILAAAREPAAKGRVEPVLGRVGILHRADDKVSKYSMGMRQRLGVAACLLGDPQLLILDEPMNGLDPGGMLDMRDMIQSLVAEGRTVVLSSHLLDEVERTCDAVAIVDRGKVIRQGPISNSSPGPRSSSRSSARSPSGPAPCSTGRRSARTCRSVPRVWPSRCRKGRRATSSPRSTATWSRAGSPSTASSTSRPRSSVVPGGDEPVGRTPMTTISDVGRAGTGPAPLRRRLATWSDHRGSWIPTWGMITTRFMELRSRRGLMIAVGRRQHRHPGRSSSACASLRMPWTPSPTGRPAATASSPFWSLGFMYVFGFIVAAVVGCTAGSVDLTEGMFRHLVITGRSRLALYLARIRPDWPS